LTAILLEELVRRGACRAGWSAEVDEAIRLHAPGERLLARAKGERASLEQGYQGVAQIISGVETES
jgi:flagellum-specific ATP synthase